MKTFSKRSLAWLASLMLLISLLASLVVMPVQAATVNYVTSGNYVYNWGERDELATFLSPMAEDFYDDNNVTYAQLASMSGSSTTSSVPYSSLFSELHELMYGNLDNPTSYDATRSLFQYTDCENSGGSISAFYSAKAIGPAWDSGKTWNREHVWPNSKSNGKSDTNTQRETDIMMLRPASVSENSSRSNTAYGESAKFYDPNELGQNVRGDAARIVLYVYVCWGGSDQHDGALDYMWGSSGVMESKDILLKWIEEDPVDTWELGRNDSVESITGTRNVFVDYPELAFLLFDEEVPAGYDSPSGEGSTAGYTVSASTNNSNYGTVSVSGNVITATPKTGYAATGYTILSGTATVKQSGNTFTVSPSSDVSVRINFGKREQLTVQFVQAGGALSTQTAYVGDSITLPAHSGSVPAGQTFLGWCSYEVSETTDEPTYYAAGATWTVSAGVTLYALYARSEEGGVVNNNTFEIYSGALTEGDYVIVYNGGAMEAAKNGTASRLDVETITIADNEIQDPAAAIVWKIAKSGNNWTLYNASVDSYAIANGTKNQLVLGAAGNDFSLFTVTGDGAYEFVNVGNKAKSVNANLRRNGTYGFACYSTTTGGALTLYKRASGTVYYFTAAKVVCAEHTYDNACDASCNVCGATRTPADHVYTAKVTTAATCGKEGVKTYTCSVCGDSYTAAIPATGAHTYDNACDTACNGCGAVREITHAYVSKITVGATCGKDGVKTYTCSVCGDSYTEAIPATGEHTYDNACDADCNACGTARIPSNHVYTAACDTTCDVCGAVRTVTDGGETTITFDADKTDRIEFSTASQVWQNGALTVTNNKGSATSNVADYSNPVRFYKDSQIIIAYPGMTSLVINAPTGNYGTPWAATLQNAGLDYEVDGGVYTVTFATPVDSITLTASAQIRANSITAIGSVSVDHVYDNANDTTCNECGAVRQIAAQVLAYSGSSISEDVNGLAFRFDAYVSGVQVENGNEYVTNSATVTPYVGGESYKVVRMGAVVSNWSDAVLNIENADGKRVVNIEAVRLCEWSADAATFAVRLINIPDNQLDCVIYARPYYVYEVDGEEIVVYGDTVSKSYNEVAE